MKQDPTKFLQEYIDRMQAKGITPTIEDLNRKMAEFSRLHNNTSRPDFEGYSSFEMHKLLYAPFDHESPIQFNSLTSQACSNIPIVRQVKRLAEIISIHGQIKLTPAGYLPVKVVHELYLLGRPDEMIEHKILKLTKELECMPVHLARILAEVTGIIKKRKGVLTLTAKGTKIITDDSTLLVTIFNGFCQKFNWAYFDGYTDDEQSELIGQFGFGYSLILLNKYGNIERTSKFYADKYFEALPVLVKDVQATFNKDYSSNCYGLRTFERFLYHFGMVEIKKDMPFLQAETYVKKTPLFDQFIIVVPHKELEG